jgi:hypothetical protein
VVSSAVVMKDLPATDLVVVTVHQDVGLDWKMLATHELTPDQAGRVEETVTAAVSPGSRLCIMATRIHRPVAAEDASGTEESTPIPPSPGNPPSCVGGTSSVVTEMLVSGGSPPSETHG